jgi:lipoprotein-anchoring transpeptidase ErfK/SrfK
VKASDVTLTSHNYKIRIELAAHRLIVTDHDKVIVDTPAGIGKADTPTPGGLYYTKELLQPPNPNTVYGHYAYGLSGFSNVLLKFAGGDGVIGIHGTNDPSGLGKDVSHGCIRVSNEAIDKMAKTLPLGVPVEIVA